MSKPEIMALILAAGMGTRMKSNLPKVMHGIGGQPMVAHVLDQTISIQAKDIGVVLGPDMGQVKETARDKFSKAQIFIQKERLGTGHAVLSAKNFFKNKKGIVLVLYGDTPLITAETLKHLCNCIQKGADVAVLGFQAKNPTGYGRLLVSKQGQLLAIREQKDASEQELQVKLCNSGVMAFKAEQLPILLDRLDNKNAAKEYYLTDTVEIANQDDLKCQIVLCPEEDVMGVNDRAQLAKAEIIFQMRRRTHFLTEGVTMIAPATVYFSYDTEIGNDTIIEPDVFFGGGVKIGSNVHIKANCHIEQSVIASHCVIGPFARLRPGTKLGPKSKIGNFCEIKNAEISEGAKVNHLTYIGDASIGKNANIGAGTITCNYDGYSKFKTEIGAEAFIGSNSSLVAPVKIQKGAYVGSGSVISETVPSNALAFTRAPLEIKKNWVKKFKEKKIANLKKKS